MISWVLLVHQKRYIDPVIVRCRNIPPCALEQADVGIDLLMHKEVYPYISLLQCTRRYIPTSVCSSAQGGISLHQPAPMHRERDIPLCALEQTDVGIYLLVHWSRLM
jgi:hypothetical protein